MAPVLAIILAVGRAAWRSGRGVGAFAGNNLFAVIALLMAEEPRDRPSSTAVIYLFVGILYSIPLSQNLARRIPPARFLLWPLGPIQRGVLRTMNFLLNPLVGVAILFAGLSRHPAVLWGLLATGIGVPLIALGLPEMQPTLRLPTFPGRLGGLVTLHLRGFCQVLDIYLAALLSIGGWIYRIAIPNPDPVAPLAFALLIVILLSTLAQGLAGFDHDRGLARFRLLPLTGVEILAARDISWLAVTLILLLPFSILAGTSAAVVALATGHHRIGTPAADQRRWHFARGRVAPLGVFQLVLSLAAGAATERFGGVALGVCGLAWVVSLVGYGRRWEKQAG